MKMNQQFKRRIIIFVLIVPWAFLLWSCDANRFYDQSLELPSTGWHKDSIAGFEVRVEDTVRPYNFYISIRNTDDYPFRNFYLFLSTRLPNNNETRDTLELILADKDGKWLGKGFGAIKDNQIIIRENLLFPLAGSYHFKIEQAMRRDILPGISDIGIRIEYAD
jgi:gliding motility-associated lipoprotein GldH